MVVLHTRTLGSGDRDALLIHGASGDAGTWFQLAPALVARGYRVIMPDLRGHGMSPRSSSYRPEDYADDLAAVLERPVDLAIGHSLGGRILLEGIDRIAPRQAVYLDPGWKMAGRDTSRFFPKAADGGVPPRSAFAEMTPHWPDEMIDISYESFARHDPGIFARGVRLLGDLIPSEPAPARSLVILADGSELVPPKWFPALRRAHYDIRVLAGAGHVLHFDDLDGVVEILDGWLDRDVAAAS